MNQPPDGLPIYRVLTGVDDAAFCHRVSEALAKGYQLYGSPALTYNGTSVILAQALIWASAPAYTGTARAAPLGFVPEASS